MAVEPTELTDTLQRVRRIARVWDEAIRVPLLGWRIGLDAIVGLVPGVGDVVGMVVGLYPLLVGAGLGAGPAVLSRMALNILIDTLLGSVPLIGDVFDIAWKANVRNRELLERWAENPGAVQRRSRVTLALVGGAALGLVVLCVWLIVRLASSAFA